MQGPGAEWQAGGCPPRVESGMRSEELGEEGERGDAYGVGAGKAVGGDVRGVEDDLEGVDWTMPK